MTRLREAMNRGLAAVVGALLAIMVVNVLWQVVTRFLLRSPSPYTEELARYLMIWTGLLGGALAAGRHAHLALDLLPTYLSPGRPRRVLAGVIHAIVLIFVLAAFVGGGSRLVWISLKLGQTSAALGLKLGYVYLALPLSGLFIAAYSVIGIIESMRGERVQTAPPPGPAEEELYE